ncbi:MAG: TIGR00341 family protein [Salibacteraceae bacterium]
MTNEENPAPEEDSQPAPKRAAQRAVKEFLVFLRQRLSLDDDKANPEETEEYIRKGIEFKGTNVWILIFAILVASIGLNMNSTAVVIGAMLISPLMGPIMGVGMGVGINDFELIKKSAKNLGLMVGISVATSTLYFWLTPLSDAQSELLARTTPTIWDVLIALFGGLAGIVAGSRKEKSHAIPGVAIATALMPPLCTAGFGIATGNLAYFVGAFYLFTINSVFISFSTIIIVRFLKYPTKQFVNAERERKVKRWMAIFVILFIMPSLYIAFNLVKKSVFEREAGIFINENFQFDQAQVISRTVRSDGDTKSIEIALIGQPVSEETIQFIKSKMKQNERLSDAELIIRQGPINQEGLDMETVQLMNQSMKSGIIEDLYKRNEQALESKEKKIELLQNEIVKLKANELPIGDISRELKAQHQNVESFTLLNNPIVQMESMRSYTVIFAYVKYKSKPKEEETELLKNWLKTRTKADSLMLIIQND